MGYKKAWLKKEQKEAIKKYIVKLKFFMLNRKKIFTKISNDPKPGSDETQERKWNVLTFLFCFLGAYNADELYLLSKLIMFKAISEEFRKLTGSPMVQTLCFHCQGPSFDPAWGTKISPAMWYGQKNKIKINK